MNISMEECAPLKNHRHSKLDEWIVKVTADTS